MLGTTWHKNIQIIVQTVSIDIRTVSSLDNSY